MSQTIREPQPDPDPNLPMWVARLEERLSAGDTLYRYKFEALEKRVEEMKEQVERQQRWIQGTALLVGLEVLGVLGTLLAGWAR